MSLSQDLDSGWVHRYVERGYKAVRVQFGVPGLPSTYGVGGDKLSTSRPTRRASHRERLVEREVSAGRPGLGRDVRETFGRTCTCCTTCITA